ncbi:MAG TPA: TM0106 family RecB-like putative nuclease [Candidatus Limnocylindria bacterium]
MQLIDGQPVYSATDLVGYLECEHLTALERAALVGLVDRPHLNDPELDVLRRRGEQHERQYLAELEADGRRVARIALDGSNEDRGAALRDAAAETERAMAAGADVVFQATFFDGRWRGHADFLLRVDDPDRPSRWGGYHYEVADTKLARHVKASAVLQICTYIDLLTAIQEVQPRSLHVVLGGSEGGLRTLRVDDFMAYYRAARARFDAAVGPAAPVATYPPQDSYPEPVDHCDVCRWRLVCADRRRADDHLSLVAGISRRQRQGLVGRGVATLEQLGELPLPVTPPLERTSAAALGRVREQARIQLEGRRAGDVRHELLLPPAGEPHPANLGLAGLPPPSAGDLFFDIEGDPYAGADGLEYLFGVMDGAGTWHPVWSRDEHGEITEAGEKRAFEQVMDLFAARLWQYPDAHIYHFAPYEPTALKKLMGRHATREDEVDRLLRGRAMVDLYRVVRQGLRASVESYSIKKLEPLYGFTREIDLRDAGSSIVVFEEWLELNEGDRPAADHLDRIERYNRDDVQSTRELRDWLEARRTEFTERTGLPVPRPQEEDAAPSERLNARLEQVTALADRLLGDLPDAAEARTPDQQARWLLTQLLSWHRRENKSAWWLYFHLKNDLTDAERIEANEPLGGLTYTGEWRHEKRSFVYVYAFPPQEYDIKEGSTVEDPATGESGEVMRLDEVARIIEVKRSGGEPHPTSLIPSNDFRTDVLEDALLRLGGWVADHGTQADGPHRAAIDLLARTPPRVAAPDPTRLRPDDEPDLDAVRRLGQALDRSTLAIQGPPGSGKTFGGAHLALDLISAGRRIGVTATSHKVIGNFLRALVATAEQAGSPIAVVQKVTHPEDGYQHDAVTVTTKNPEVRAALAEGTAQVAAGTPWLWAREDMAGAVDVLFVDEAGQMSLANVLASAQGAGSLVLLGDPQQLDQPTQGSHPPGAGRSALAHLLDDASTMPDHLGLFLETTWRLHPDLCDYTSEVFYEDRLEPEAHLAVQALNGPIPTRGTGARLLTVDHAHNDNDSVEEAETVERMARGLVEGGATWVDQDGVEHPVTWNEVLIVAAYNAQVGEIRRRLPAAARVGTVDKFQGQEAPISIYSMASSSADDAPRGMNFLYSGHRLNVATSRARCVALIVASPQLFRVRARTPDQMRLANAFARFAERALP